LKFVSKFFQNYFKILSFFFLVSVLRFLSRPLQDSFQLATSDSPTSVQKTLRQRFARLIPFFGQPKSAWAIAFFAVAIAACTEPLIPAALKPLLDRGFTKGSLNLWIIPVTLITLFGVRGIAGFVAELAVTRVTSKGLMLLRQAMFSKVLDAKFNLFADQTSSELANTVVYEVNNGSTLLVNSLMALVRDAITLVALVGYLLYLNWQLTTIVAIMLPAVAFIMVKLSKKLYGLSKSSQKATDDLAYVVEENVLAHRDIRLHAAQPAQAERFMGISDNLRKLSMKTTAASAAMKPLTQMIAAVALSAIISVALLQSADGVTSVGEFTAFVTGMLLLVAPIKHLSEIANPITRGLASLERGFDLLDLSESEQSGSFSKARADGHIEFLDTSVKYKEGAGFAVENLSLSINHGETIALVGSSGSGKTTLVNLLPRFLEPFSGNISLDNELLKDWDLTSLRNQFSLVSQHVVMLNDTVANNVALGVNNGVTNALGNPSVDRTKVFQCLEAARLGSFIADLPQGIDTTVGHNAVQLSGGQRQRLAIARALYKDAPILILDEATSALDAESERAVQEALQILMKNRTTLVIAHRLSTVEHADRIVVMEAGKIIEIGSHAKLLAENGFYAKLYRLGLHTT
jgi:ATP-binding cassette, subfamily B, bacterial MsbA